MIELVELNGVKLTPWHPIKIEGAWKFPSKLKRGKMEYCDVIYNLVLDNNHSVFINGLEVVTLGHGLKDNLIVEHEYFGTEKVVNDLKKFKGWDNGKIFIDQWRVKRDPINHRVQGLLN